MIKLNLTRIVPSGHGTDLAQAGGGSLCLLEELDVGPGEGGHVDAGSVFQTDKVRMEGQRKWTPVSCWRFRFGLARAGLLSTCDCLSNIRNTKLSDRKGNLMQLTKVKGIGGVSWRPTHPKFKDQH